MIFLCSPISSSKSIFRIVVITSPCACWISATLAAAFFCTVLLLVLRLVSVVVLWFALPAVGSALLPAVGFALLGSCHHRSRSSCSSRCPRTLVALLRSCRHRLVGCGSVSDSHHLLLGCGSFCGSFLPLAPRLWFLLRFFLTTCSLAVVPSVLLLQSHFVVSYDSVRF